jgi:LuxR family transcriptional regulator, quorum-sensing system regulator CinR
MGEGESMKVEDKTQISSVVLRSSSVQDAIEHIAKHFGVDHVTLHLMQNIKAGVDNPFVRTTYPSAWVSHYLLNNFVTIDPIVQHAMKSDVGFSWSEVQVGRAQLEMFKAAQEFGVGTQGYTSPTIDDLRRRSLLSVNSSMSAQAWVDFVSTHAAQIDSLARDMHLKALAESSVGADEPLSLSPREHECLRWTAEGKTYSEIAIILNLSEHTVRSYLKVVRLKLDSVSMPQAVAKASNLGLI